MSADPVPAVSVPSAPPISMPAEPSVLPVPSLPLAGNLPAADPFANAPMTPTFEPVSSPDPSVLTDSTGLSGPVSSLTDTSGGAADNTMLSSATLSVAAQPQTFTPTSTRGKELQQSTVAVGETTTSATATEVENVAVVEVPSSPVEIENSAEISPEVEAWVEQVGQHEAQPAQEVKVMDTNTAYVPPNLANKPIVVLPVTQQSLQKGLHLKITESAHWLSFWCLRLIKKFHGMIAYREVESPQT